MSASPLSPRPLSISINTYPYHITHRSTTIDDDFDCVKVEISDLDGTCPNPTSLSLIQCKKKIILPFRKLLCLIGWRPFGADNLKRPSICLRILNIVYPIFIFLLLLFNYTYEVLLCPGGLNIKTDTKESTTTPPVNHTWTPLGPGGHVHVECGHIFTTYIIPDIFHCIAFVIGLFNFRITEGEPLYSLMERVFINADESTGVVGTNRAIRRLNIYMLISCIWMLLSVFTAAFSNGIYSLDYKTIFGSVIFFSKKNWLNYIYFIIDIICLLISNSIFIAVVMNYVCHCEMIIFYCKTIRIRLEEKSIHLLESTKRILDLGTSISQLNGAASRMMSILIIVFLARSILGLLLLILNRIFTAKIWIYRSMYIIVWFSILAFCLGQASRVANKCNKFRRISLSMRVYGYHNSTPSELDGFLLFVSQADLRVKLFGLTVRPGKILIIGITVFLILVVLFQTSILSDEHFFF